ncbi:MAG: succinate dehydrogenase iron-sulfur subunit [Chlamydiales bacterium 38-26]|nr:succinate dehydrogenase iron-sulfur subunit [Chlamydiales bacterium]OJV10958.1 MAG: succinate dehydrogenase iron-sulfur subunit [Chlamydiales bacterium 38-26]
MQEKKFILRVFRGLPGNQYWEDFELPIIPRSNIISSLMYIQRHPYNKSGEQVEPVSFEAGCLEEVCGSCSMLINGRPRQSCTALVETLLNETASDTILLAPFTKFPLVRDLIVDRTRMFNNLIKVQAWIDADGAYDRGPGPKMSQEVQEVRYSLSTCMTCGCCVEACPQSNQQSKFVGPQIFAQVRLFNTHPTGKMKKASRLRPLMEEGGISDCGNAQNCSKVCPKHVPLLDSIAAIGRDVTGQAFKDFFDLPEHTN